MDDFEKLRKEIFERKRILHEERLKMTFEQKIDELEETLAWLGDSGKPDYSYTPCYGTHGNIGRKVGECIKCHQPIEK
jgi:hypothetical protein